MPPTADPNNTADSEYTIDGLARIGETTVRSIRVYHERGVLPPPEVRGRIGYYGPDHLYRLRTISRLLARGMKINGIKELLDAWDRGDGLAEVLGVADDAPTAPDAEPVDDVMWQLIDHLVRAGLTTEQACGQASRLDTECARLADVICRLLTQPSPGTSGLRDPVSVYEVSMRAIADFVDRALRARLAQDHPRLLEILPEPERS